VTFTTEAIMNILHPGLILILSGLLVMCLPKNAGKAVFVLGPIGAAASLLTLKGNSLIYCLTSQIQMQFINADKLGMIFAIVFCMVAIIGSIYSLNSKTKMERAVALVYAGANLGVVLAGDCISLIVFWEISAFTGAYLVYANHTMKSSHAAYRYLLVHAFGGGMLLAGLLSYMMHYGNNLDNLATISGTATYWIIFIGVAVNAAVPPINSWLPDAYPEATLGGTVFLSSYTTKAAIYLMIRLFAGTDWIVWVGCFMAIYGILMALLENDLRRLFAYHIISQLGYMVASLGVGSAYGIDGAAAHAFNHILYKGTLMMCAGAVIYATGKRKISELGGLGKKMPLTAFCFLIASFAISGFPFLNGFASKALIMHAVKEFNPIAGILLTAASVGTWLSVALKVNVFVFWGKTDNDVEVKPVPLNMQIGMCLGSLACIVTGVCPNLVYGLTPFGSDGHPFTLEHILEYLILFAGGTLMFYVFRKVMKPHDEISLDFDWFYRVAINAGANALSKGLTVSFQAVEDARIRFSTYWRTHLGNPYLWTENSKNEKIRNVSIENEDHPVGLFIFAIVTFFLLALLTAFFVI